MRVTARERPCRSRRRRPRGWWRSGWKGPAVAWSAAARCRGRCGRTSLRSRGRGRQRRGRRSASPASVGPSADLGPLGPEGRGDRLPYALVARDQPLGEAGYARLLGRQRRRGQGCRLRPAGRRATRPLTAHEEEVLAMGPGPDGHGHPQREEGRHPPHPGQDQARAEGRRPPSGSYEEADGGAARRLRGERRRISAAQGEVVEQRRILQVTDAHRAVECLLHPTEEPARRSA